MLLSTWREWTALHMLFFVTFLVTGLTVNLLQAVLYVLIGCWSDRSLELFRRLNYYLVWTVYSQLLFVANWWSGSLLRIHSGSAELLDKLGKEHTITIMNHHYELDWMIAFMASDHCSTLGNARVMAKSMLRYVPVIGWLWNFSDVIYLDRDWEKDRAVIAEGIRRLAMFPDPMFLLLFAEGTRFSPEKHAASREFAKQRGGDLIPELKHHLIPRTKGFAEIVRNMDLNRIGAVYDVTVVVNEREGCPATVELFFKLSNLLTGKRMVTEMFIRRIPSEKVPRESDEEISRFLMKMYADKDALKDNFLVHGSFTRHGEDKRFSEIKTVEVSPRIGTLVNTVVLNLLVGCPIVKVMVETVIWGSLWQAAGVVSVVAALYVALRKMIGLTKISKASAYGGSKKD